MILPGLAMPVMMLSRRARLECVNRPFRRFCAHHATRMRQHTEVVVPVEGWDAYVLGASRWLAWHAVALRTAYVRFEVRRRLPKSVQHAPMRFCTVHNALCHAATALTPQRNPLSMLRHCARLRCCHLLPSALTAQSFAMHQPSGQAKSLC